MAADERRKHRRVRAKDLAAHVRALDRSFTCSVENLSEGGIFLATDEPLPRGSIVAIDLVKPGAPKALRVIGVVVAEASNGTTPTAPPGAKGMGIQFAQPSPEARAQLLVLIGELTGHPARALAQPGAPGQAGGALAPRSIQAIVTPFAGETRLDPAAAGAAEVEKLRGQVLALRSELATALRERTERESELQTLRAQLVAARSALPRQGN
ncbi:MAG: hypothetical protein NVS2B9_04970 [Myxococcales bacterium]